MKKFVCPDCGKEYSEDNIPMECTTCGCPSDMIKINEISDVTPKMNFCPQCGSLLPSQQVRFCPNCGCELSSQKLRDVDTICPDCNSVITDVNKDCPICGCPSNMFIQRAKTKFLPEETLECPDCGKIFVETIPADCPNCGCPSDKFTKHKKTNAPQNTSSSKNVFSTLIIIVTIIGIIVGLAYVIVYNAQQAAEQARQEQYAKEQQERREREEAEERSAKEQVERENRKALSRFTGTYTSGTVRAGNQSGYGRYYITFYSDMTFYLRFIDSYTNNELEYWRGTYTFYYEIGGRLINNRGKELQKYYITNNYTISINGIEMTK